MKKCFFRILILVWGVFVIPLLGGSVNLTEDKDSITVFYKNKKIIIKRNQNIKNRLNNNFTKTSRECPPFCIQEMYIEDVHTVGELDVLEFIQGLGDESDTLLLDVRTTTWHKSSTIPGSVNLPFTMLKRGGRYLSQILKILGARKEGVTWTFKNVQTLMIYGNGVWDAQAKLAIERLLDVGYPNYKILYYRGGMQSWQNLGLSVE